MYTFYALKKIDEDVYLKNKNKALTTKLNEAMMMVSVSIAYEAKGRMDHPTEWVIAPVHWDSATNTYSR